MLRFIILVILAILLFIRVKKAKEINPALIFEVFWVAQCAFIGALYMGKGVLSYGGLIWILCTVLMFRLGYGVANKRCNSAIAAPRQASEEVYFNHLISRVFLCVCIVVGIVALVCQATAAGLTFKSLFDLQAFLKANADSAHDRYFGESEGNLWKSLALAVQYSGAVIGGYAFPVGQSKKDKLLSVAVLLPVFLSMLLSNAKAGFIGSVIFWCSAFFVSKVRFTGSLQLPPMKKLRGLMLIAAACILILFMTMVFRQGEINEKSVSTALEKFSSYAFGHVPAFDYWFTNNAFSFSGFTFGAKTFLGISKYFGVTRLQGVYEEYFRAGGLATNVYTYFRGLVEDIGPIAVPVLFALLGFLIGLVFDRIKKGKGNTLLPELGLEVFFMFSLYYIVSIFTYTSYICAILIFGAYLVCTRMPFKGLK